jgi:hypothetical protein
MYFFRLGELRLSVLISS